MATTSSVFFYLILIMLGKTIPVFYAVYERTHNIISNLHRFEADTPLTAMSQVMKEIFMEDTDFFPIKPVDYGRFLVISLGTGSNKQEGRFTEQESSKRGVLRLLYNKSTTPIIAIFSQASADVVDIHASVLFQALCSEKQYLRIQDDILTGDAASLDISRKVNLENGNYEPVEEEGTNEEALTRFAQRLSSERKLRNSKLLP